MNTTQMNELKEIHDAIKIHPFRISFDKKYLRSYGEAFKNLIDKLYQYTKEDNDINHKAVNIAYHDWMSAVCACKIRYKSYDSHDDYMNHYLVFMDKALGEIHHFLDFGNFITISTYINKGSSLYRNGKLKDNELIREYRLTNKGEWLFYTAKEHIQKFIDIYSKDDSDFYKSIVEYYKQLYDNYEENWGLNG